MMADKENTRASADARRGEICLGVDSERYVATEFKLGILLKSINTDGVMGVLKPLGLANSAAEVLEYASAGKNAILAAYRKKCDAFIQKYEPESERPIMAAQFERPASETIKKYFRPNDDTSRYVAYAERGIITLNADGTRLQVDSKKLEELFVIRLDGAEAAKYREIVAAVDTLNKAFNGYLTPGEFRGFFYFESGDIHIRPIIRHNQLREILKPSPDSPREKARRYEEAERAAAPARAAEMKRIAEEREKNGKEAQLWAEYRADINFHRIKENMSFEAYKRKRANEQAKGK